MYYTVRIPYTSVASVRTEWHPTEEHGPFSVFTRGYFATATLAVEWAVKHLSGAPYSLVEVVDSPMSATALEFYQRVVSLGITKRGAALSYCLDRAHGAANCDGGRDGYEHLPLADAWLEVARYLVAHEQH